MIGSLSLALPFRRRPWGSDGAGGFSVDSVADVERVGARDACTGEVLRAGVGSAVFDPAGVGVSGWRSGRDHLSSVEDFCKLLHLFGC